MPSAISLPKWTELLVALYNTPPEHRYSGRLHRRTGMTLRHLRNLISLLEDMDIVVRPEGKHKIKPIQLTETGSKLAELFLEVHPMLRR